MRTPEIRKTTTNNKTLREHNQKKEVFSALHYLGKWFKKLNQVTKMVLPFRLTTVKSSFRTRGNDFRFPCITETVDKGLFQKGNYRNLSFNLLYRRLTQRTSLRKKNGFPTSTIRRNGVNLR